MPVRFVVRAFILSCSSVGRAHSAGGHPNGIVEEALIPVASEVAGSNPATATYFALWKCTRHSLN